MTRIQTRISHVHPTASIHQRGTLLRLCYCGVLRAGAPPATSWRTRVLVTRSEATVEAMDESCLDDSGIKVDRACGGPGPTGGGPEQENRGRIRADDVYPECWRSIH